MVVVVVVVVVVAPGLSLSLLSSYLAGSRPPHTHIPFSSPHDPLTLSVSLSPSVRSSL